jgi:hypothetical protein
LECVLNPDSDQAPGTKHRVDAAQDGRLQAGRDSGWFEVDDEIPRIQRFSRRVFQVLHCARSRRCQDLGKRRLLRVGLSVWAPAEAPGPLSGWAGQPPIAANQPDASARETSPAESAISVCLRRQTKYPYKTASHEGFLWILGPVSVVYDFCGSVCCYKSIGSVRFLI